VILFQFLTHSQ